MRCLAKENSIEECGFFHGGDINRCRVCPMSEAAAHYSLDRVIKELLCSDPEGNGSNLVEEIFLHDAVYYLEEYRAKIARERTVNYLNNAEELH